MPTTTRTRQVTVTFRALAAELLHSAQRGDTWTSQICNTKGKRPAAKSLVVRYFCDDSTAYVFYTSNESDCFLLPGSATAPFLDRLIPNITTQSLKEMELIVFFKKGAF